MAQYIYSMVRARKAHGDKVILDDFTLAFLPGAKIGVVGPNGAGKSTVLKIMAGMEQASNGEAILSPGYSVGMLQQEPPLNEKLDVRGNVVDSPRRVSLDNGAVTNFRMASTARRYDAGRQEFVDSGTFWVDVECWNGLSGNVSASISKGDPVLVHGALTTHSWESENGRRSNPRIKAFAVGPNLNRGTSVFKRDKSGRSTEAADATASGPLSPEPGDGVEEFPSSLEELLPGRDYVGDDETLNGVNPTGLSAEPAHV